MIKVIRSAREMFKYQRRIKERGGSIALVPTMGALHEGHLSLVAAARQKADHLVVSIFVNPLQFAPAEDINQYPRDLNADKKMLEPFKPLVIFHPTASDLYPEGFETEVQVKSLSKKLCGQFRPGHFAGVATVVAKLFNIVQPDHAFFGEKDYQQQLIIKKLVRDLNYDIHIHTHPTVREYDGLALSSRNAYLTPGERKAAGVLYRALTRAKKDIRDGETDVQKLQFMLRRIIGFEPTVRIQYLSIVDPETLENIKRIDRKVLVALAVHIGKTRLIDNMVISPK